MIIDTPSSVKQIVKLQSYNYTQPKPYVLNLTSEDYDRGYVDRYFVGNINYFNVVETNAMYYNMVDRKHYRTAKVNWKISGPEFNVYTGNMLETIGVINYNTTEIKKADAFIPNIQVILNNPKQFWRGY